MSQADDRNAFSVHEPVPPEPFGDHLSLLPAAPPATDASPSRPAAPDILPIVIVGLFAVLNLHAPQPLLPLLRDGFAVSPTQAALVISITVVAVGLTAPFAGALSDAYGRRPVTVAALFGITLPTLGAALAPDFTTLLVCRFLQGLFVPAIVTSILAYISEEWDPALRGRITGYFVTAQVIAGFGGRFVAGLTAQAGGWRFAFLALGLLNLAGALIAWRLLQPSRGFSPSGRVSVSLTAFRDHIRNKALLGVCMVAFAMMLSFVALFTYATFYLSGPPFNLSPAALGAIFVTYLLAVTSTPAAGRLIDRFGPKRVYLVAACVATVGILLTGVPSLVAVFFGLVLCSAGIFSSQSACTIYTVRSVTTGRSSAVGVYYTFYYAGGAVGAVIVGLAYEKWGWTGSILLMAFVQLASAGLAAIAWRSREPGTAPG